MNVQVQFWTHVTRYVLILMGAIIVCAQRDLFSKMEPVQVYIDLFKNKHIIKTALRYIWNSWPASLKGKEQKI